MHFLLYFFLAHFLADYPLQSTRLVQFKTQHFFGVMIHGLIHLLVMLIVLYPILYETRVWVAIGMVYLTHNLIDQIKVKVDKKEPEHHRFFYFLDQYLHWSVLIVAACYVDQVEPHLPEAWLNFYTNKSIFLYFLALVLSTYFYDVSRYFLTAKLGVEPYVRNYKKMALRGVLVTLIFGIYWWLA